MRKYFFILLTLLLLVGCKSGQQSSSEHAYTNMLVNETSPYLLQHAHNPVDWNPWGDEALAKAKKENKLLIISIGYAACHWCHVMEHESFEDTIVAQLMNEHFVSIKVDREERPDVDDVYMTACQVSNGGGCGWPLNAIALPDGRPIWAGTYFPKKKWIEILTYFQEQKEEDFAKMEKIAENLTSTVKQQGQLALQPIQGEISYPTEKLTSLVENILAKHDFKKGGRSGAPKFPMPDIYHFLQEYTFHINNEKANDAVRLLLDNMAAGGIYDQLGGGFARYSTDKDWKVPHFEKMLYDNAQLISLYANAYAQKPNKRYKEVIDESIAFVLRELSHPKGGFYSSLDADSDGEEGLFYIWDKAEIDSLLKPEEAAVFNSFYNIKANGNWEHGHNILFYSPKDAVPTLTTEEEGLLVSAKTKLFNVRAKRVRPALDDKVLTSWNGLMIIGLLDAAASLGSESYYEAALKTASLYAKEGMDKEGRLWRNSKDGVFSINGFLDDYALMAQAFVRLYEASFDEKWLYRAEKLLDYALEHFSNKESELYFYTSDIDSPLVSRRMEIQDNVIAASNSALAEALFDVGHFLNKESYVDQSERMLQAVLNQTRIAESPTYFSNWLQLLNKFTFPVYEVAIVGDDASRQAKLMQKNYLPNVLYLGGKDEGTLDLLENKLIDEETFIYVCRNKVCKLPVMEAEEAIGLLED